VEHSQALHWEDTHVAMYPQLCGVEGPVFDGLHV
jgi:hypothetical protein